MQVACMRDVLAVTNHACHINVCQAPITFAFGNWISAADLPCLFCFLLLVHSARSGWCSGSILGNTLLIASSWCLFTLPLVITVVGRLLEPSRRLTNPFHLPNPLLTTFSYGLNLGLRSYPPGRIHHTNCIPSTLPKVYDPSIMETLPTFSTSQQSALPCETYPL